MTRFSKLIFVSLSAALIAGPAAAQADPVDEAQRQLAALRQREADIRHRLGQLQLDALIERVGSSVMERRAARPAGRSVARWTAADLSL